MKCHCASLVQLERNTSRSPKVLGSNPDLVDFCQVLPNFQIRLKYGSFYCSFLGDKFLYLSTRGWGKRLLSLYSTTSLLWANCSVPGENYCHCTVLHVCCRKTVMYCVRTIVTVQYYKSAVGKLLCTV